MTARSRRPGWRPYAADRRAARRASRPAPPTSARGAVLPVRPLPADREQPARRSGRESPGHLERLAGAVLGQQVHDQHQHRDELLAGGGRPTSRSCTSRCSIWSIMRARTAGAWRGSMYGARGFVIHHNTDVGDMPRRSTASGPGIWPLGGAWLALHFWDHYDFTRDAGFLRGARLSGHEGGRRVPARLTWSRMRRAS